MWRLLESRLRPELPVLAVIAAAGALASLPPIVRFSALRISPERVACVYGLVTLILMCFYSWSRLARERRESRLALHVTLPVRLGRLGIGQLLELVVPPLAVAVLALTGGVLGRAMVGGAPDPLPLWLLGLVSSLVLAGDQSVTLAEQLYARLRGRRGRWTPMYALTIITSIAILGVWLGPSPALAMLEALRPFLLTGRAVAIVLAVVFAMAVANHRLFLSRPDFLE